MDYATRQQPAPAGHGESVTDWLTDRLRYVAQGRGASAEVEPLISDLLARRELGRARYGDELRTGNGRDVLVDAYQEALDLLVYLAQGVMDGDGSLLEEAGVAVALCGRLRMRLDVRDDEGDGRSS